MKTESPLVDSVEQVVAEYESGSECSHKDVKIAERNSLALVTVNCFLNYYYCQQDLSRFLRTRDYLATLGLIRIYNDSITVL